MNDTNGNRQLSAEDILSFQDMEIVEVQVPEWKGVVHLRVMPASDWMALQDQVSAHPDKPGDTTILMLSHSMCTATGERLFPDFAAAKAALGKSSSKVVRRLEQDALRLNSPNEAKEKNA